MIMPPPEPVDPLGGMSLWAYVGFHTGYYAPTSLFNTSETGGGSNGGGGGSGSGWPGTQGNNITPGMVEGYYTQQWAGTGRENISASYSVKGGFNVSYNFNPGVGNGTGVGNVYVSDGKMGELMGMGLQTNKASVGQPGEWESLIPVWGPGRAAIDHFQNGNYWSGLGYTALAISDIFLVKSIATGIGRGAWKLGSHSWNATRKWMVNNGYAGAGEPLHHWAITQATAKKYGVEAITNQPWNLVKFSNQSLHMRAGHGMNYLGQPGYGIIGQFWYGTPTWFKAGIVSGGGRIVD